MDLAKATPAALPRFRTKHGQVELCWVDVDDVEAIGATLDGGGASAGGPDDSDSTELPRILSRFELGVDVFRTDEGLMPMPVEDQLNTMTRRFT